MQDWKARIREASARAGHVLDSDIADELSAHCRSAYDAARAEGCSHAAAEEYVLGLIGGWMKSAPGLRRASRRTVVEPPVFASARLAGLANDFLYGLRLLARQRAFAALSILTMALGFGVMTTLFSVAYGVLLKPLPWPEPARLIRLSETRQGATRQMPWTMTNAAYLPWLERPSTIEGIGAWSGRRLATLTGGGDAERIYVAQVTAGLFPVLGAAPFIGSLFTAEDETPLQDTGRVILSYGLWQKRFGGDPAALGKVIHLDGKPRTVAAVMPPAFAFPDRETLAWLPFYISPVVTADGRGRTMVMFSALARLAPGATPGQAAAEATARARNGPDSGLVGIAVFGSNGPAEVSAAPAADAMTGDVRPALVSLLAAVALLMVTAVANVASLQLARASTRLREMAIRSAIGAGRRRIARQLLIESLLLGAAGGLAGLLLAAVLHSALPHMLPPDFPRLDNVVLDWSVAAFALAVTFTAGLTLGVLPALYLCRLNLVETLSENGPASSGGKRATVPAARLLIMTGQVAIACTLLIGAALLGRSFLAMLNTDRGFDPGHLLTARLAMPDFAFTPQRRLEVLDAILRRLRQLPGAAGIGFTTGLPLISSETVSGFTMPSLRPPAGAPVQVHSVRSVVSQDYFRTLGMRIADGRGFSDEDTASSPRVAIVNRAFARQYLSEQPVGDRISNFARGDGVEYEVIGIVDDVRKRGVTENVSPEIYSLDRQMSPSTFNPNLGSLVLRGSADPRALLEPLKTVLKEQDSSLALESIMTMEDRLSASLARPRFYAVLVGAFALCALAIAGVGLFGVLSYSVAQRSREIAIRTALGARPWDVVRIVLKQGLAATAAGLSIGISVSLAATSYLATLLYGVAPRDWPTIVAVSLSIGAIAAAACLAPALRAARIEPRSAMRAGM